MTIQSTHPAVDRSTPNKRLVDAFIQELFTHGDLSAVDRYLDHDFVNHDPPFPGAPDTAEGMRQAAAMFRAACPDWHSDVEQLVEEGDVVVERFTARGTRRGELMGAPATGEVLELRGINIFRVEGDRIVERWGRLDEAGLARQLGLRRPAG
ncbi:MAG: ester cyclase [Blastococcus sp.]